VKHSAAPLVRVRVRYGDRDLGIEVTDDGPAREPAMHSGGHGLIGMRERVALYDGRLRVGSGAGSGFTVDACLPLNGVPR
jgi:signal transduction histidine kinase